MHSHHEEMMAIIKVSLGKMEVRMAIGQEQTETEIKPDVEKMNATDFEANPEETETIAEHQEVPNKEAAVETIGAWED
jgi:hypothetical protein